MFNGNYVKIDSVLASLSKYPFMEGLSKREAAHKLVALLSQTGATTPLVREYKVLEVVQHKAELPSNIMYIHGVKNHGLSCNNSGVPMKYATDIYHSTLHSVTAKKECAGAMLTPGTMETLYGPKALDEYKTIGGPNEMSLRTWQIGDNIPMGFEENSYTINGTSLDTSFPYGFVTIAYDSVKVDEEGFPMIPDNQSFKEAFKYFMLKEMGEPDYIRGNIPRHIWDEISTQYAFYIGQASSRFKLPSPDQMESMINGLVRILPRTNNHSDGWKSFNKKEDQGGMQNSPRTTTP